ncbi:hypothetical protein [Salinarimonas sp.]|uniref:hypothetical protein n=1 Tax=Salinarimonas sp. TaxID=2766526 RepID=UPI00391B1B72
MTLAGLLGGLRRKKAESGEIARVKTLAREALALADDVALAVNEIVCADPACPGLESVILVMAPGRRTRALKVQKPLSEVEAGDIVAAAAEAPDDG